MTCLVCGRAYSWATMHRLADHVYLVLEADVLDERPPCGVALNADVESEAATFLCLEHAASVGRAATKALKVVRS